MHHTSLVETLNERLSFHAVRQQIIGKDHASTAYSYHERADTCCICCLIHIENNHVPRGVGGALYEFHSVRAHKSSFITEREGTR
jgi:hypothetical protein